jgi:chorismate mutase
VETGARSVRAIRGATTFDEDEAAHVTERVVDLLKEMLARNGVQHDDLISILFTATDDLHSIFPATAARTVGLGDVPLICARELNIDGGKPRCIRVLLHCMADLSRAELHHVYLEGTRDLRDDLPE